MGCVKCSLSLFVFRNSVEKLESKGTGSEHLSQPKYFYFLITYFLMTNRKKCLHKFKKYVILLQAIEYG